MNICRILKWNVLTNTHSFIISFTCTLIPTLLEVLRGVCAHVGCLIWAVSPMCGMQDKCKQVSSPHYISGVPLGGDDKLVLTSFVYILCVEAVRCYGMVLSLNLA